MLPRTHSRAVSVALTAFMVAALAGGTDAGAAERVIGQASFGERLYVLRSGDDGARIEGGGVAPQSLSAEIGAYAVAATKEGWLVTGTVNRDGAGRIALVRGSEEARRVRAPRAVAGVQASPQPVVDAGRWVGLVWLEGEGARGFGVRSAERAEGGFGRSEWVSAPGAGSQQAPEVTVLADGSWLAVWTSVRGGDEDIVFSWRGGGEWSPVRRVHSDNAVPDVAPAVAATGLGALAAWGRYDGSQYRVRVSRFADGRWVGERWLSADPGSHPYFVGSSDLALVNAAAAGGEWSVFAVEQGADLREVGRWPADSVMRPVVRRQGRRWNVEFGR